MDMLLRLYRTFNLLSLDVAIGAIISALYFSKLLIIEPSAYSIITLGLTVWIIYTADRLLDVRNSKGPVTTDRHKFHQRYQNQLWFSIVLVVLAITALLLWLPQAVLKGGILLAVMTGLYLFLHKKLLVKEFVIAILYTMGILLPSWSLHNSSLSLGSYLLIAQFFIVALINLLLFSWFDYESDKSRGSASFVTAYGKKLTSRVIWVLNICSIGISGWMLFHFHTSSTLVFLFMTFILAIISLFPAYFSVNCRYRFLGDAVFFLPAVGIFI